MPAVVVALSLLAGAAAAQPPAGMRFHDSIEDALRIAAADKKVTVVYFTATWCTWCRKMSVATLADRRVTALAAKFVWAKVDVGREFEAAARYQVNAVPRLIVLNVRGEILADADGYQTVPQLLKLLRPLTDKAEEAARAGAAREMAQRLADAMKEATPAETRKTIVRESIEQLAKTERAGREEILELLEKLPRGQWTWLLEWMEAKALAVRAAAGAAIALVSEQDLPFDPFAKPAVRANQIAAWRKWLDGPAESGRTDPRSPATRPAGSP